MFRQGYPGSERIVNGPKAMDDERIERVIECVSTGFGRDVVDCSQSTVVRVLSDEVHFVNTKAMFGINLCSKSGIILTLASAEDL